MIGPTFGQSEVGLLGCSTHHMWFDAAVGRGVLWPSSARPSWQDVTIQLQGEGFSSEAGAPVEGIIFLSQRENLKVGFELHGVR